MIELSKKQGIVDIEIIEDWKHSMDEILETYGEDGVRTIIALLHEQARLNGIITLPDTLNTPYLNSITVEEQPRYPGDLELEKRIENIIRWNAMAMVLRGVDNGSGVGGHIATYASASTMLEVGFNHFFRGQSEDYDGDLIIPQPHAAPGIYARAFLEGRLTQKEVRNFRRELQPEGGLSAYPHPYSMPNFWQVPCASMGLSTPTAIYQARFSKYLESRNLKKRKGGRVWCFIGDGEADEPEVLGTIGVAAREKLDNLVIVICNWNKRDDVIRCLDSLKTAVPEETQVIVVDNASTDGSVEALEAYSGRPIHLLKNEENLGGTGGFNSGIREALKGKCQYVHLLDNDVIVEEQTFRASLSLMEKKPEIGAVGSKLYKLEKP